MTDQPSDSENPNPWQTQGRGKKKKNRKTEGEDTAETEGSTSSNKRTRRTHKEGGNLRERKEIRESKKTKGFTNVTASTSSGITRLGPMYKPPSLVTKATNPKALATGTGQGLAPDNTNSSPQTIADKQAQVKATYARMLQESTGKPYEVVVYKKDRSPLTREDQWTIQFGISNSLLEATRAGKSGDQIAHSGTRLNHRYLSVFCGPTAGPFYKEALNKVAGFEAFLPEERRPGHEIFATLPGYVEPLLSRLPDHFAAGTFGAIQPNQVRISRKAWRSDDRSNFRVFLELDDEAFQWLGAQDWMSSIGLYITRWAHPPIRGVTGYIRPDQDLKALRRELEANTETDNPKADSGPEQAEITVIAAPQQTPMEDQPSIRSRHVTGDEDSHKEKRTEENAIFEEELTEEQERELLENVDTPSGSSTPSKADRRKRGNGNVKQDKSKVRRRFDSKGNPISDVSSESESDS